MDGGEHKPAPSNYLFVLQGMFIVICYQPFWHMQILYVCTRKSHKPENLIPALYKPTLKLIRRGLLFFFNCPHSMFASAQSVSVLLVFFFFVNCADHMLDQRQVPVSFFFLFNFFHSFFLARGTLMLTSSLLVSTPRRCLHACYPALRHTLATLCAKKNFF